MVDDVPEEVIELEKEDEADTHTRLGEDIREIIDNADLTRVQPSQKIKWVFDTLQLHPEKSVIVFSSWYVNIYFI